MLRNLPLFLVYFLVICPLAAILQLARFRRQRARRNATTFWITSRSGGAGC
ncbi:hypothetical protein JOM49_005347 [Amycolatopsis magusensis]|uniref:Uncharacterized protein n=1 Tax=Amycolatopsis magusensis TaxID=882444 RepID=A0ABS4PZ27_9PSEU|nr:hypothetical protein [Amycolatopsis magusensis]